MPKFYFDTSDGVEVSKDRYGIDLPDVEAARRIAVDTLPHMAQDAKKDQNHSSMSVNVKDQSGKSVLDATLVLVVEMKA